MNIFGHCKFLLVEDPACVSIIVGLCRLIIIS